MNKNFELRNKGACIQQFGIAFFNRRPIFLIRTDKKTLINPIKQLLCYYTHLLNGPFRGFFNI